MASRARSNRLNYITNMTIKYFFSSLGSSLCVCVEVLISVMETQSRCGATEEINDIPRILKTNAMMFVAANVSSEWNEIR